ncbi:hypothetical protein V8G54_012766 [Vigna mungo]|uniref:Uncharacterized protein n=1 Tax=Vigna mungo TaxID=3915 RepID=A0AAQ3NSU9_VIGMU
MEKPPASQGNKHFLGGLVLLVVTHAMFPKTMPIKAAVKYETRLLLELSFSIWVLQRAENNTGANVTDITAYGFDQPSSLTTGIVSLLGKQRGSSSTCRNLLK